MERIVLFDGECHFCNQSVQFIIKRDPKERYKFASLQSEIGKALLDQYQIPHGADSLVLIEGKQSYIKSAAALRICKHLKGVWKLAYLLLVIPKPVRDFFYNTIAKNRYRWFGSNEYCRLPSPEERKRFI